MSDSRSGRPRVLVVGAGPAGLVAAIVLARYGVGVLVVEKRAAISALSRALVISTRTMEILRSWGLEDDVRTGAADVEPCGWITYTLAAGEGTEIPLGYPTAAQAAAVNPTRPAWAPQDHLEPLLLAHLQGYPGTEVRFGAELIATAAGVPDLRPLMERVSSFLRRADRRPLPGSARLPRRRRRAPDDTARRHGHEHSHPGRL